MKQLTELTYDEIMALDASDFYSKVANFFIMMGSKESERELIEKLSSQGTLEEAKEKFALSLTLADEITSK